MYQNRYILGLGTSWSITYINLAIKLLKKSSIKICAQSNLLKSAAIGGVTISQFTNCAVAITTNLCPEALWLSIHSIEHIIGRRRVQKNDVRCIDIDVLYYFGTAINNKFLQVPHPHFWHRDFAYKPALEVCQKLDWILPPLFLNNKCKP